MTGTSVSPVLNVDVYDFCRLTLKSLCLQQQHTTITAVRTTITITPTIIPIITLMDTIKASIPSANALTERTKKEN